MIKSCCALFIVASFASLCAHNLGSSPESLSGYYRKWSGASPLVDRHFFPVGVWLQDPRRERNGKPNGVNYADLGINVLVGMWEELSLSHIAVIPAGLYVMPGPEGGVAKSSRNVVGYVVVDEPDMPLHPRQGGCMLPDNLSRLVNEARAFDGTRPVLVNFGKYIALPDFVGGSNCPYTEGRDEWRLMMGAKDPKQIDPHDPVTIFIPGNSYASAYEWINLVDIVSVDHYATTDSYEPPFHRQVWGYGRMVRRMNTFAHGKPGWAFIQVTDIGAGFQGKPTPQEVRSFVWLALVNGARGIEYFVHCLEPRFIEDCIFEDPKMREAVKRINLQIHDLAPVLNTPDSPDTPHIESGAGIDVMTKVYGDITYIFAVGSKSGPAGATFTVDGRGVEVLGEQRMIAITDGHFSDSFDDYTPHLYRVWR